MPRWPVQTLEERFWARVDKTKSCWPWTGYCIPQGYGIFNIRKGKWEYAHRMAWNLTNGSIPFDLHVLHRCDTPPCCNPDHLWTGTHQDNMADCKAKGRKNKGAKRMKNVDVKLETAKKKRADCQKRLDGVMVKQAQWAVKEGKNRNQLARWNLRIHKLEAQLKPVDQVNA